MQSPAGREEPVNDPKLRVLFVHGLMSSPGGRKARYLAERFDALTPKMETGDFSPPKPRPGSTPQRPSPQGSLCSWFTDARMRSSPLSRAEPSRPALRQRA